MKLKVLFRVLALLFICVEIFTIIVGHFHVRHWVCELLFLLPAASFVPKAFFNRRTTLLVMAYVIMLLYVLTDYTEVTANEILIQGLAMITSLGIFNTFTQTKDYYGLKLITAVGMFFLVVIGVTTIVAGSDDTNIARDMVDMAQGGDINSIEQYQRAGVASYGLIHSIPFLIPILVCNCKYAKNALRRVVYIGIIIELLLTLFRAGFATPLILGVQLAVLALLLSRNPIGNIAVILSVLCIIFVCMKTTILGTILLKIAPVFDNTPIQYKIDDIVHSIDLQSTEGQVKGREDLYADSLNTFLANPFFGNPSRFSAGGHSFFMDRLAYFGLFGCLPLFAAYLAIFKVLYNTVPVRYKIYVLVSMIAFFMMGFLKNLVGSEYYIIMFIFVPGLSLMEMVLSRPVNALKGMRLPWHAYAARSWADKR